MSNHVDIETHELRRLISESNMTLDEIAKELSINKHTIYKWMSGVCYPTPRHFDALKKLSNNKDDNSEEGTASN